MQVYLNSDIPQNSLEKVKLTFVSTADIHLSEIYFKDLSQNSEGDTDSGCLRHFEVNFENNNFPASAKVELEISLGNRTFKFVRLKKVAPGLYQMDREVYKGLHRSITYVDRATPRTRSGKFDLDDTSKSLGIDNLFGLIVLSIYVNGLLYIDPITNRKCTTQIHLFPNFVSFEDLSVLIEDFNKKQLSILSIDDSLQSFFSEKHWNSFSNEEMHFEVISRIYNNTINILSGLKLATEISRKSVHLDSSHLYHRKGSLKAPQKIEFRQNRSICYAVDRIPFQNKDLIANRLIKKLLLIFIANCNSLSPRISENINDKLDTGHISYKENKLHREKLKVQINSISHMRGHFEKVIRRKDFAKDVTYVAQIPHVNINTLQHDFRYKKLNYFLRLLTLLPDYKNYSYKNLKLNVQQLDKLYEDWCIFTLHDIFEENEFQDFFSPVNGLQTESYTKHVKQSGTSLPILEYKSKSNKYHIKIFREKVYQVFNENTAFPASGILARESKTSFFLSEVFDQAKDLLYSYDGIRANDPDIHAKKSDYELKKYRTKRCPDISIEIFDLSLPQSDLPSIVTLDCHFSKNKKIEKFAYMDTICGYKTISDYNNKKPIKLVTHALDIFWGIKGYVPNYPRYTNCFHINLNPSSKDSLKKFFTDVFKKDYSDLFQ